MKKLIMSFGLVILCSAVFATKNAKKASYSKTKQSKRTTLVACTPSTTKVFHTVDCPDFSWYRVDYVDTTIVTCENGVAVSRTYHWDQNPNLVCS